MNFFPFLIIAAGLTVILTLSRILRPIRPTHHFFHCPMCMGFWIGLILWSINGQTELFTFDMSPLTGLGLASASSITSWILAMLGMKLEKEID